MRTLAIGLDEDRMGGIAAALSEFSYSVVKVASSAHALVHPDAESVRLIVLHQRPGFDAAATCRHLREAPAYTRAAIVVMVGSADAPLIQGILDAGADEFFFDTPGDTAFRVRLRVMQRLFERGATHREASDDLDVLFAVTLDLLCIGGLDGRFRRVSPSWTKTLGWSAEQLCSCPWLDFVHPDDRQRTIDAASQLDSGATVIAFVNRYRCSDGRYRLLEWRVVPSIERGLVYASARDVTDERAQQEALRELAQNVTITLDSIGDGVISVDGHGAIVRINPVAEHLTGWTERDALAQPIADVFRIIDAHTRASAFDPVACVLRENRILSLSNDTLLVRRDGTEVPIADSCAPIRDVDGGVSGAVLVFRDITAEVSAKRAQDLAQQQLVFADRMASVGTLAAGMAHEINNPLAAIVANLDLVVEELHEPGGGSSSAGLRELEDMVEDARSGAERIKKIVRGLKTFSRAEHELRSVISVNEVIELAITMTINEIRHRTRLIRDYAAIPLVHADDARLGQVFINLLVNAAHSIPEGHIDDNEIRILTSTDRDGRAVVEIHDTGEGIPPTLLSRIFDPFFTTKPVGIGAGLGLAICHNIITGMGGEISVRSTVGKGSQFKIILPAAPRDMLGAGSPSEPASPGPTVHRAAVLVVDDEPSVGVTLARVLRDHRVTVQTRAQDALELVCSGQHFDVIFSDIMMPGMSGKQFYEQLAVRCPEAAEKVVFISGGAFTHVEDGFLDSIPNERLEKPFDNKAVRTLVQRFAQRHD